MLLSLLLKVHYWQRGERETREKEENGVEGGKRENGESGKRWEGVTDGKERAVKRGDWERQTVREGGDEREREIEERGRRETDILTANDLLL